MILCKKDLAKKIDSAVFPGTQGGPLMHVIAAKAVALKEAAEPSFAEYQKQVVANCSSFVRCFKDKGHRIISGGSDNHLFMLDVGTLGFTGAQAEKALDDVHIVVNKNLIPFDTRSPKETSGIRIGSPAVTTRGLKEKEIEALSTVLHDVITAPDDNSVKEAARETVRTICERFPLYNELAPTFVCGQDLTEAHEEYKRNM
jgi:glycine hydroxymethyltransferase